MIAPRKFTHGTPQSLLTPRFVFPKNHRFLLPIACLDHSIHTEVASEESNDVIPVFQRLKAQQVDMSGSLKQV